MTQNRTIAILDIGKEVYLEHRGQQTLRRVSVS